MCEVGVETHSDFLVPIKKRPTTKKLLKHREHREHRESTGGEFKCNGPDSLFGNRRSGGFPTRQFSVISVISVFQSS